MEKHKYYEQARRAHYGTSFTPEKRADQECAWYDETVARLIAAGKESAVEKYTALWLKHMAAKARCLSSMITGPARFPVARNEKHNRWERSAGDAVDDFLKKVFAPPPVPRQLWRDRMTAKLRLAYDGKTMLVPGIPEAADQNEAYEALEKFKAWAVK